MRKSVSLVLYEPFPQHHKNVIGHRKAKKKRSVSVACEKRRVHLLTRLWASSCFVHLLFFLDYLLRISTLGLLIEVFLLHEKMIPMVLKKWCLCLFSPWSRDRCGYRCTRKCAKCAGRVKKSCNNRCAASKFPLTLKMPDLLGVQTSHHTHTDRSLSMAPLITD